MNRTSKIFWPVLVTPKDAVVKSSEVTSRSQKLMHELGLIKSANNGTFQILPIAQRVVDKCLKLVNHHISNINAQKITLPLLTSSSLWKKSGRLEGGIEEFFMVKDRQGKDHLLSPTHEEAITSLIAMSSPISYKNLPIRLYQIGPKFRDELKPRFGLMRAKEFLMKDLYTFDRNQEEAETTYDEVNDVYLKFFNQIEVPFVKVIASSGMMGGNLSHEYHFISNTGEDRILKCSQCDYACNEEVTGKLINCPNCNAEINDSKGIEIAHAFLLKDKYSKPLGATFLQANGKPAYMSMGCYGIGITRLIAASLEVLSTENELRWPTLLAPFDICIISPKDGSKEYCQSLHWQEEFYAKITEISNNSDTILIDDRNNLTIGKRLLDSKRMGYPLIIVIGSKITNEVPKFELFVNNNQMVLEFNEILKEIGLYFDKKKLLLSQ